MNGVISTAPPGLNTSGFDFATGLGTLTWTGGVTGSNTFVAFFDHEIDEATNTFFNEYGAVSPGGPAAGQSWEIDEPGFRPVNPGDIYANVLGGTLDNSNGVPFGSPDDVSMALGWTFGLNAGETASISFYLSTIAPLSGFYLEQLDPDGGVIYLSSGLDVTGGTPVPLPGAIYLMGSGLALLMGFGRKRLQK